MVRSSPTSHRRQSSPRHARAVRARPLVVLAVVLLSASAHAEGDAKDATPLAADATLARLIAESLAARPELAQARATVHAERERIPQVDSLPDPMLQVGIQNDGFTSIEVGRMENSYVSFMASQTFPWPGTLSLRREVARLDANQSARAIERLQLSTEAEVRRAYLELALIRDRLALLDQLDVIWQKSFDVARVRYEAGDGAQSDVLRAQLEKNRIKQRRAALRAGAASQVRALNRLRNHHLDEPIATATHVRDLPALGTSQQGFSVEQALARSPELAAARLGIARAGRSVALAEKSYYPDLVVGAGIMVRGALPPMWLVTVGGTVPVFAGSKQSHEVAESQAWSVAAEKQLEIVEQLLRLRSEERKLAFAALVESIDLYDHGLLVQSEATAESTLAQYTVGKVTFASVLEANAGFVSDQDGYLQALADAQRILIAQAELSLAPTAMPAATLDASVAMPGSGGALMAPTASGATPSSAAASGGSSSSM